MLSKSTSIWIMISLKEKKNLYKDKRQRKLKKKGECYIKNAQFFTE